MIEVLREEIYRVYRKRLVNLLDIHTDASRQDIDDLIESGFSARRIKELCELSATSYIGRAWINPINKCKTKLAGGRPAVDENSRFFRLIHIIAMAETIFGDGEKTRRWLLKPKLRFAGKNPMEMLSTAEGACQVEEVLIQLAEGLAS